MTNNKLMVVNGVAARIYEENDKISIEWFVRSDPQNSEVLYRLDDPKEFQRMSLYIQNSAKMLQGTIDKTFYGREQENSVFGII